MISGGKMGLFTKLILPFVLITVLGGVFITVGFAGTSTNPTITKPPRIQKEKPLPVVDPVATYKKTCGQCHLPYPPQFLPSGSWEKLLATTEKHFEGTLEIDQKTKVTILAYLKKNGAEFSKEKIPQKIMKSLGSNIPLRLTEVPYILKKHRKISSDVFQKKSIGSFSTCNACHLLADKWIFNRKIVVPQ
jgi:hypothetical protein